MELRLKKSVISDWTIFILTVVMLCFKDYNTLAYLTQVVVFVILLFIKLESTGFEIRKYQIKYLEYKFIFILWCFLSYAWAAYKNDVLNQTVTLMFRAMTGFSIIMYVDNRENKDKMIKYLIIAAMILCARMAISVPMSAWGSERVGKYLAHDASNSYGNTGITYVLGIVCVYLFPRLNLIKRNWVRYVLILVFSLFSLLSGSRKHIVILMTCVLITSLLSSRSMTKTLRNIVMGIAVTAAGLFVIFNNALLYEAIGIRLLGFLSFTGMNNSVAADVSSIGRGRIIQEAIRVFAQNPICGVGIANFKYYNRYTLIWAENNYLELLTDVGIIGLILYYLLFFEIFRIIRAKFERSNPDILLLLMLSVCLLFVDSTMVSYTSNTLQFHLACLFAFCQIEKYNVPADEIHQADLSATCNTEGDRLLGET